MNVSKKMLDIGIPIFEEEERNNSMKQKIYLDMDGTLEENNL